MLTAFLALHVKTKTKNESKTRIMRYSILEERLHAELGRYKKMTEAESFYCGSVAVNPTSIHEDTGLILGLAQWVKDPALLCAAMLVTDAAWI